MNHLAELCPETLEVFAIKGNEAFIGGKTATGDFHFISVPFTEPKFQKKSIDNWGIGIGPLMIKRTPDPKFRERIWIETYLTELKKTGSIICASADAGELLAKFDELFTTEKPLI